jgi:hypothetical protein
MKQTRISILFIAPVLLSVVGLTTGGKEAGQQHSSGLMARVTLRDGTVREGRIEGVGCSWQICSRTLIRVRTDSRSNVRVWLDSIAAVRQTTPEDALFELKDGTRQRLSFLADFRVLYFETRSNISDRVDLRDVRSVEALETVSAAGLVRPKRHF